MVLSAPAPSSVGTVPAPPDLTVIVPTRNEAGNVAALLRRLDLSLRDRSAEVLVVDDSDDDTPAHVLRAGERSQVPVRLLHRTGAERSGGLGGAVVDGMCASAGSWVVVMDGDLQHPPELVPRLLDAALLASADLVVASRRVAGGEVTGLAGRGRRAVSAAATWVTKALFPRALKGCSDPMSGFFAVRRDAVDLRALRPRGFKILLELAVRSGPLRTTEVPLVFGARGSGASKAGIAEGRRFLRHLVALRLAPPAAQLLGFAAVGLSGLVVNTALLWWLATGWGAHYVAAAVVATQGSSLWNAALTEWLVFRRTAVGTPRRRVLRSVLLNNAVLVARLPLLVLLVSVLGIGAVLANAATLLAAFLLRFHVTDRHIYAPEGATVRATTPRPTGPVAPHLPAAPELRTARAEQLCPRRQTSRYLPHRYDVAGVLTLGSEVPLPELEWFRAASVGRDLDIEVRVGMVGGAPRRRTRLTTSSTTPAVAYEEHLGRRGANFEVDMGDRIRVTAGPLLARSPHVLYTNVVEALLRFVMVSRGRMLLHSACLDLHGSGLLLSARTDTGKTGTVLRLIREHGATFLSDDMTVLAPDGTARCFPKPLTISQHTLRAVQAEDLNRAEWRRLRVQSWVHSREGRSIGTRLAEHNLPIMSVNALTQIAVPPPKYAVQRLVDCDVAASTQVRDLFVIERGSPRLEQLGEQQTVDELIANTDDAYGFPPFRWFAPTVVLGDDDYLTLRAKERELLTQALRGVTAHRLASDSFSWADEIPALLSAHGGHELAAGTARADAESAARLTAYLTAGERALTGLAGTRGGRS